MIYHPCTEDGQRCIQTPSIGLRHPSLTAREVVCSRRSLQLIVRPTSDCHDWLYDQSQIATAGCTTNPPSLRLIVRPIADCHSRLHDQSQIATTGCTTNHRLPRLVVRPITALWGLHGLCWHVYFRRCRVHIYIYIHDWLYDQSPDCHGWLCDQPQLCEGGIWMHDQSQLSAGCTASAGMSTSGGAGCISTCTFTCPSASNSSASGCDLFALPLPFFGGISLALHALSGS